MIDDPVTMQTRKRGAVAAIRTRYHGPTDHRGSRFTAMADDTRDRQSVTVGYDYALDVDANHAAAAEAWLDKFQPRRRRALERGEPYASTPRLDRSPDGLRQVVLTDTALVFAGDHYHTWTDRGAA